MIFRLNELKAGKSGKGFAMRLANFQV